MWPRSCTHTTAGAMAVAIGRCAYSNVSPRPVRWKLRRNGFKRVVPVLSVMAVSTSWFPTPAEGGCRIWGQTRRGPSEPPVYYRRFIVHDGKQNCSFLNSYTLDFFLREEEKKNKKNRSPPRLAEQRVQRRDVPCRAVIVLAASVRDAPSLQKEPPTNCWSG